MQTIQVKPYIMDNIYYGNYDVLFNSPTFLDKTLKEYIFTKTFKTISLWINHPDKNMDEVVNNIIFGIPLKLKTDEVIELTRFLKITIDDIVRKLTSITEYSYPDRRYRFSDYMYHTDTVIIWNFTAY